MNYLVTHHFHGGHGITLLEAKNLREAIDSFKQKKSQEIIVSIWDGRVISFFSEDGVLKYSSMFFSDILNFQFDWNTSKFSARVESGL